MTIAVFPAAQAAHRLLQLSYSGLAPLRSSAVALASLSLVLQRYAKVRHGGGSARGRALVVLSEAVVTWQSWQQTDADTAQRLAVNRCLKDVIWATAAAAAYDARRQSPVVDVEIDLCPMDSGGCERCDDDADWSALWALDGAGVRVTTGDGWQDTPLAPGEGLLMPKSSADRPWAVRACGTSCTPAIVARVGVYRLSRSARPQ